MLPDKFRTVFRKEDGAFPQTPHASAVTMRRGVLPGLGGRATSRPPVVRQSRGLEQFFFEIRDVIGLSILDLAGAHQENINFLIDRGHKVYTHDLMRSLDEAFGKDPAEQTNGNLIEYFLRQNFDYPADTFDGVLVWDLLQFMGPALLNATIEKLHELMRPKSYLLAFFTARERALEVPSHSFRIMDNRSLSVTERGMRPAGKVFNNRNIEKLFNRFGSVKFFLTRESLREVIVRR